MAGSHRFQDHPDLPIGAILAGGAGTRLNRGPKPLVMLNGLPVIGHVINALTPQVRGLMLGLREPTDWADRFALPVITDTHQNIGPAASITAVLSVLRSQSSTVLTAPADSPFLPPDLTAKLHRALTPETDIAVAVSDGQPHHLVALWRTAIASEVEHAVSIGVTAIRELQNRFRVASVVWPTTPYDPFFNINTPEDLTTAQAICSSRPKGT